MSVIRPKAILPNGLAMHRNFNDLNTETMEAKEWFEKSDYQYTLDEHDEGGYLGINDNKVGQMLEEYHQAKLKLLGIANVVRSVFTIHSTEDEGIIKIVSTEDEAKRQVEYFKKQHNYTDFFYEKQNVS
jgi:hypothetical protein